MNKLQRTLETIRSLEKLGFAPADAWALRRIQMRLHRWDERQCGDGHGCVEIEDDGRAFWHHSDTGTRYRIPNQGAGAEKQLAAIMKRYPKLWAYHQSDCRGCALYIGQKSELDRIRTTWRDPAVALASVYSSIGTAVTP